MLGLARLLATSRALVARLAPGAMLARLPPPPPPAPQLCIEAAAPLGAPLRAPSLLDWLADSIILMAVPKKRTSYTRKRVRQAGQQRMRGPHHQGHMSMCPVCERMRMPHRVCDREDCQTYWKHRWF